MSKDGKTSSSASGGISFTGALTITFIILKLTGVIDWPWLWVLSPVLISVGIVVLIVLVVIVALIIAELVN